MIDTAPSDYSQTTSYSGAAAADAFWATRVLRAVTKSSVHSNHRPDTDRNDFRAIHTSKKSANTQKPLSDHTTACNTQNPSSLTKFRADRNDVQKPYTKKLHLPSTKLAKPRAGQQGSPSGPSSAKSRLPPIYYAAADALPLPAISVTTTQNHMVNDLSLHCRSKPFAVRMPPDLPPWPQDLGSTRSDTAEDRLGPTTKPNSRHRRICRACHLKRLEFSPKDRAAARPLTARHGQHRRDLISAESP